MLKYTHNLDQAAGDIENAVKSVLEEGYWTSDIYEDGMDAGRCER